MTIEITDEDLKDEQSNEATDALGLTSGFEAGSYAYDLITHNIQAANAIFAVAGGTYAWEIYNADFLGDMEDSKRLVALCRSAETVEQCQTALDRLELRISQSSSHVGFWSLLCVHVVESMNHEMRDDDHRTLKEPIKQMLEAAVSSILLGSWEGFLLKEGGSVDLFAFHLLDTVYERQHTLSLQLEETELSSLLYDLDDWVLPAHDGKKRTGALDTLMQCARWCFLSLNEVTRDPSQTRLQIFSAHDENDLEWKAHLEIYGTLWYKLFMQQLNIQGPGFDTGGEVDEGALAWAQNSRRDLGISHAEVLSCMCWIIVNHGSMRDDGDGTWESLFGRSRAAAHEVWNTGPRELWIEFLHTFKRFNDLTATEEPEYERSRNAFMEEFVAFVKEILKVFVTFGASKTGEMVGDDFYPVITY
ncbi:hypothetical protein CTAM01_02997 [Colletotrichum tamarilloi]|uniref:Uncharacterized protein n=1 Tax=Colletotrichum tamarilloi TaxID=1209934 RepID=A0ABQ9RKQ7_9PEZI|nr:uncharacterized protein CTAM01_02997 [Colletotrichum tamarilloi]KAK1506665.1 hypothetical protein CTAM01_02997 [Colletotrichum tamarilloi]